MTLRARDMIIGIELNLALGSCRRSWHGLLTLFLFLNYFVGYVRLPTLCFGCTALQKDFGALGFRIP